MRKLFALLIVAATVSLYSCGGEAPAETEATATPAAEETTPAVEEAAADADSASVSLDEEVVSEDTTASADAEVEAEEAPAEH